MGSARRTSFFFALIIGAAVLALYSVSIGHNFLFDEENIILRNPYIKSWASIPELFTHGFFFMGGVSQGAFMEYYRPLTTLTFLTDYQFWQGNPLGYNVSSTMYHLALSLVFFGVLARVLGDPLAAFAAAALYAVHPLHTEALGHVSCRGETLGALFLALTLLFYFRGARKTALASQLLGLLCKESAVLIPIYLLAGEWSVLKSRPSDAFKRTFPSLLLSMGYVLYRKFLCPVKTSIPLDSLHDIALRVFSLGPAMFRYGRALFAPKYFDLFGWIPFAKDFSDGKVLVTAAVLAVFSAAVFFAWRKRGAAFFGLVLLAGGLIPFSQIVHFYPEWAEHFLTIPAMGAAILAGVLISKKKTVGLLLAGSLLLFFGYRTYERNVLYNDLEKYYGVLSKSDSPYAANGYQELAKLRLADNKPEQAGPYLRQALALGVNQDVSYYLLGYCDLNQGHFDEALVNFQKAQAISPENGQYALDAGRTLIKLRQYEQASSVLEKLLEKNRGLIPGYLLLMKSKELSGYPADARQWAEKGLTQVEGNDFQGAVLTAALMQLAYRQGWRQLMHEKMNVLSERYSKVPWYGDLAFFLTGKMEEKDFRLLVRSRYPGFEEEAEKYIQLRQELLK